MSTQYVDLPPTSGGGGSGITELTGDVSALGPGIATATVNSVGGQSAANIASATVLVETPYSGNLVLASPADGSSGLPAFRKLVLADIPGRANIFTLTEDFATSYYSPTTGQVFGDYSWATLEQGSGALTGEGSVIPSTNDHPGILELTTTADPAGGIGIITGVFNGIETTAFLVGAGEMTYDALIYFPVISDGTDNAQIDIGFRNAPGWAGASQGISIQYQIESSPFWRMFTTASSSTTTVTSTVLVTTGWHHVMFTVNATGTSVEGFVDGVSLGTSITDIPVVGLPPMISLRKTLGTTPMYLGIDYIRIEKEFTNPR